MIKAITKIVAGVTAAAALLLTAGCKNQLDYVDDTTALNQMYIQGFKVTGLDEVYNQATAQLVMVNGDTETVIASATVADTAKVYDSGCAKVELKNPKLYDGDSLKTSKFECYLKVNGDEFKVADPVSGEYKNAVLDVVKSPAGTSANELAKRFVEVTIYDGVASFAFASKVTDPSAVSIYQFNFDISACTSDADVASTVPGVTLKSTPKAGSISKYTIKFTGLTKNVGTKFVVAGASIGSKAANIGDNWNIMTAPGLVVTSVITDKDLVSEVDEDGNVEFVFYGSSPSWADNLSPAIKIAAVDVDCDPWVCLLSSDGDNWFFPDYTDGKDVVMTVDAEAASESYEFSEAEFPAMTVKIDGIKIVNAPLAANATGKMYITGPDGYAGFGDADFTWGGKAWNTSTVSYESGDFNVNTKNFGYTFLENEDPEDEESALVATAAKVVPYKNKFRVGARLIDSPDDTNFWESTNLVGNFATPYYNTADFAYDAEENNTYVLVLTFDATGKKCDAALVPADVANITDKEPWNYKLKFKVVNADVDSVWFINGAAFNWAKWPYSSWGGNYTDSIAANPELYAVANSSGVATFTKVYEGIVLSYDEVNIGEFQTCGVAVNAEGDDATNSAQHIEDPLKFTPTANNETWTVTVDASSGDYTIAK